ncbi:hypothetical protein [Rhodoblastus sp.]
MNFFASIARKRLISPDSAKGIEIFGKVWKRIEGVCEGNRSDLKRSEDF